MAPQYSELIELLIEGSRYDDAEDVQSALDQGVDINAQDEQGRTAVHMAAANGHLELLQTLINSGASVVVSNIEGNTPLHWACVNNQKEAAKLLLSNGASPSALNVQDMTPVDEALIRHFQDIVDLINQFSAPIADKQTNSGLDSNVVHNEEIDDIPDDDSVQVAGEDDDMALDEQIE